MQEFKVETSALPAQYGHHSAAAVNAVTKSGTNVLHGSGFEFFRDKSLNATNAVFGGGAGRQAARATGCGGPVRRDAGRPDPARKLFYFGGYQGTKVHVTPTSAFANSCRRRDARGRFLGDRVAGVQQRARHHAGRAVRRQHDLAGAVLARGDEHHLAPADRPRSLRPHHLRPPERQHREDRGRPRRLPVDDEPLAVRARWRSPISTRCTTTTARIR